MGRILLIDDEPEMVRFIQRALENEGHRVTTCTDGAEGLRRALADDPDLVVLDLLMPGVNGQAVLGGLITHDPEDAEVFGDQVLYLREGLIEQAGTHSAAGYAAQYREQP